MVHTTLVPSQAVVELALHEYRRSKIIQSIHNNGTTRMGQKYLYCVRSTQYLIDSNVLIDYMAGLIPAKGSDFVEKIV